MRHVRLREGRRRYGRRTPARTGPRGDVSHSHGTSRRGVDGPQPSRLRPVRRSECDGNDSLFSGHAETPTIDHSHRHWRLTGRTHSSSPSPVHRSSRAGYSRGRTLPGPTPTVRPNPPSPRWRSPRGGGRAPPTLSIRPVPGHPRGPRRESHRGGPSRPPDRPAESHVTVALFGGDVDVRHDGTPVERHGTDWPTSHAMALRGGTVVKQTRNGS